MLCDNLDSKPIDRVWVVYEEYCGIWCHIGFFLNKEDAEKWVSIERFVQAAEAVLCALEFENDSLIYEPNPIGVTSIEKHGSLFHLEKYPWAGKLCLKNEA